MADSKVDTNYEVKLSPKLTKPAEHHQYEVNSTLSIVIGSTVLEIPATVRLKMG